LEVPSVGEILVDAGKAKVRDVVSAAKSLQDCEANLLAAHLRSF
jgi:hypothetical protein